MSRTALLTRPNTVRLSKNETPADFQHSKVVGIAVMVVSKVTPLGIFWKAHKKLIGFCKIQIKVTHYNWFHSISCYVVHLKKIKFSYNIPLLCSFRNLRHFKSSVDPVRRPQSTDLKDFISLTNSGRSHSRFTQWIATILDWIKLWILSYGGLRNLTDELIW